MTPVRVECHPEEGTKKLYISGEYLWYKEKKIPNRKEYLRWLTSILKRNGFWKPSKQEGNVLRRSNWENSFFVLQTTDKKKHKDFIHEALKPILEGLNTKVAP